MCSKRFHEKYDRPALCSVKDSKKYFHECRKLEPRRNKTARMRKHNVVIHNGRLSRLCLINGNKNGMKNREFKLTSRAKSAGVNPASNEKALGFRVNKV